MNLWLLVKEEKVTLRHLTFFGFVISLLRVQVSQDEDMGYLLSISSFVENGYRLYKDIFEIKDPLFFYAAAISMKVFGLIGPYVIETILITLSASLAFLLGRQLRFSQNAAILSSVVFTLVLTGLFYQSFRTQIFGIILFLALSLMLVSRLWLAAGFLIIAIIGFKMPIGAFIVGLIPLVFFLRPNLREFFKLVIGFFSAALLFVSTLSFRGEFYGYLEMVRENVSYSKEYQQVVGLPSGFVGHLRIWDGDIGRAKILLITCMLIHLIYRRNRVAIQYRLGLSLMWGVLLGTFIFLGFTALWPHHLQILSIPAYASSLALAGIVFPNGNFEVRNLPKSKRLAILEMSKSNAPLKYQPVAVALILIVSLTSGVTFSINPRMPIGQYLDHEWRTPPEIALLNSIKRTNSDRISIARLGMVDDAGLAAFLDHSRWKYACNRFGIGGFESKEVVDGLMNCIDAKVKVITLSPMFLNQVRPGIFPYYKEEASRLILGKFTCSDVQLGGYQLCVRKSFSNF